MQTYGIEGETLVIEKVALFVMKVVKKLHLLSSMSKPSNVWNNRFRTVDLQKSSNFHTHNCNPAGSLHIFIGKSFSEALYLNKQKVAL